MTEIGWAIPAIFSVLCSILIGLVLMFLRGIGSDVKDVQLKTAKLEEKWQMQLDQQQKQLSDLRDQQQKQLSDIRDQQQKQVADLRVDMAKVQEQLAALLRGAINRPLRAHTEDIS